MNFWDKIADSYSKRPIANEDAYQKKLAMSREYFRPDMQLLEFGCGTGGTALLHAPHVAHIAAIDGSANMINIAKQRQQDSDVTNVDYHVASIEEYQAEAASFDAVLGLSILHLLEDRDAVTAKVFELLKPGGVFISSTACLGDKHNWLKLAVPFFRLIGKMPPVLKFFTVKELQDSFIASGFTIEKTWKPEKGMATFIIAKKPS